jgi:hypothetical protein
MGKTAGGALWLDAEKTSPYEFYQYWRNVDDADVENCLALLTFLPMDEVRRLGALKDAAINEAKKVLAYEVTKIVHGEEEANKAKASAEAMFGGSGAGADIPEIKAEIGDDHSEHEALGKPIYDVQPRRWTRRIFAPKYFMPLSKRPETATCFFGYTEIPIGESIRFAVTPMDAFGNRGKTIYSKVSKFTKPAAKAAEPAKPAEPPKPAAPAKPAEKPAAK